jgi:glycosyltransferase involved in cell wall biosynthesis
MTPEQLKNRLKSRLLGQALPCYVISHQPLIIVSYWQDFYHHSKAISEACPEDRTVYVLAMLGWQRETPARADALAQEVQNLAARAPQFQPLILTNSPVEEALLRQRNLNAVFCHQNAFLDENRYRLLPHCKKKYDAIYIARITPFKRHELASEIDSLRLIGSWHDYEQEHRNKILRSLPQAQWREKVWSPLIYRELNAARVGLCLSAEEGAMFVSAEYLLCGLPIVSTANMGGRDHLFNAPFALTVEAQPRAIAEGVASQIARHHDPRAIRAAVIENMQRHRRIFIALVQAIYDSEGLDRDFNSEWHRVYTHKLGIRCHVPLTIRRRHGLFARPARRGRPADSDAA